MSVNRPEWVITDWACAVQGFVSVPLYDTLGADAAQYMYVWVCPHPSIGDMTSRYVLLS
jgi:long-subunit acyl-CoA synthetase (AMP-forming)